MYIPPSDVKQVEIVWLEFLLCTTQKVTFSSTPIWENLKLFPEVQDDYVFGLYLAGGVVGGTGFN